MKIWLSVKPCLVIVASVWFSTSAVWAKDVTTGLAVTEEVSQGGIAYSLITMPDNPRVTVQIAWPSQWSLTGNNNPTIPHIATRLILEGGADGYPPGVVGERFTDMESQGYLVPGIEMVYGTLHYSPEHQEETIETVNAHLVKPNLDDRYFKRLRDQFVSSVTEQRSQHGTRAFEAIRWALLGDLPLRNALSLDAPNTLDAISRSEVQAWTQSVLTRNGATVVIAGDLQAEQAGKVIDQLLQGLPDVDRPTVKPLNINYTAKRILLHEPTAESSLLTFIAPMPPLSEGSEFEDVLLTMALGGGNKSRLFEAVRTELRASYSYGAGLDAFTRDQRLLVMSGEVDTDKVAEAEKVVKQAYSAFIQQGIEADLEELKQPILNNLEQSIDDTGSTSHTLLMSKLTGFPAQRLLTLTDELKRVDQASLRNRLDTAFPAIEDFLVLVGSPDRDALPDACVITSPEQAADC